MTQPDTTELRTLAEAATPGPWRFTDSEAVNDVWEGGMVVVSSDGDPIANVQDEWYENDPDEPAPVNDAAFIAAASPTSILALLDRLDAAETKVAAVERLQQELANPDVELIVTIERAHRRIVARELDALRTKVAAVDVVRAAAVGWELAHNEACSLGTVCSAHQPIDAPAQRPRLVAALALAALGETANQPTTPTIGPDGKCDTCRNWYPRVNSKCPGCGQ